MRMSSAEASDQRTAGPTSERTREETVTEPHCLHGSRVLVVDDEGDQAFALALLLREDEGILATSARDSNEALEQVKTSPIDAVVLDVKMPGLSGPDLLAVLRKNHPGLPAVLLTGYERYDARLAHAMASGGVAYCAKPASPSTVVAALVRLLGR